MARGDRRQNLARLGEIAQVAARHGFGYAFGHRDDPTPINEAEPPRGTRGQRVRAMLDELGPTFVKFGQVLSTRPDIIPPDIIQELRGLQDDASPVPFDQIRAVLEEELGKSPDRIFAELDETPVAAASIGQVHRAKLPDGQVVVIKVQRPDAERRITADLQLLHQAARVARQRVRRLEFIDVVGVVEELSRTVRRELDYGIEARNAEAFRRNFAGDPNVVVPRVFWRYTTQRVLTMERVEGVPLSHYDISAHSMEERKALANRLAEAWMQMLFVHGFFHADPHPANILVVDADRIGLVDFGMTEQLSPRDREAAVRLLLDILDQNAERLPRRLRALGVRYPRELEQELAYRIEIILQRYSISPLGEIDAREVLREIFQTIYKLDVVLPSRWIMLDKTLATLAGVGLEVYPDFNVFEVARPYANRLVLERFRPDRIADRVVGDVARYGEALAEYPFQIAELLEELRDGELEIRVRSDRLPVAIDKVQSAMNRVALALVAFALLLGSAIISAFVEGGPQVWGAALAGLPPLVAGLGVMAWLFVGIFRSGRW